MQQEIKQKLIESIADNRLDNEEKSDFFQLLSSLNEDQKRYLRNQAFDLARDKINQASGDMDVTMPLMKWLERIVKLVDNSDTRRDIKSQAFFSPGDACRDNIVNLLQEARQRVDICVFTISDDRISTAILGAHKNNVAVRILTDNDKANDRGSDVYFLREKGVPVLMDTSPSHMHHKFALVDDYLINGSFNWTRSASERNQENIVVSDNLGLCREFERVFNRLWSRFRQ